MSMKIVTPLGQLKECHGVKPFVEELYKCKNKEIRRAHFLASKDEVPSGVKLVISGRCIYIGNLRPENVEAIIHDLLETGYYDFRKFQYQEPKREKYDDDDVEFFVWDDEKLLPYHTEGDSTYEDDIISNLLGFEDNIFEGDEKTHTPMPYFPTPMPSFPTPIPMGGAPLLPTPLGF